MTKLKIKDSIYVLLGILSATFSLKGFILPNNLLDGGAMGISLIIAKITPIPIYILILIVNIPFLLISVKVIDKYFTIKTIITLFLFALSIAILPMPVVTNDMLLVSIFGGFFLGLGIGLSVRGGAVLDGTEVLAIYLSRKNGFTIGELIMLINVIIFIVAAYLFGVNTALYSMITYLATSKTLDFIIEGIDEYIGVTIISDKSNEIKQMIIEELGRGVTIYNGKRGKQETEVEILYTVFSRLELNKFNNSIEEIDPKAFLVMNTIRDTKGGLIKKKKVH